jgi:hypothetical protein
VVTLYPLRSILHNPGAIGNFAKWATELVEFKLEFTLHHAFKSKALVDFLAEWTPLTISPEKATQQEPRDPASVFIGPHWVMFFDGSACSQGCGAGVVLMSPNGEQLRYVVCLNLKATNNMA